jgi:hypothetical protein
VLIVEAATECFFTPSIQICMLAKDPLTFPTADIWTGEETADPLVGLHM